jgi:ATP-dependent RNA/DNA helicase IGHMBP2
MLLLDPGIAMIDVTEDKLPTADEHFERLLRLLELEAEAEKAELLRYMQRRSPTEAEESGNSLINLVVRAEDTGLGGRSLLTLGKRNHSMSLPWTRLRTGTPVVLSEEGQPEPGQQMAAGWRGVVSGLTSDAIQVAFPGWPEAEAERPVFRLDRSGEEIVRRRQRSALERVRTVTEGRLRELRDIVLGYTAPLFAALPVYEPLDDTLNESQQAAVRFALAAEDVSIIHGPPGTGKTTTVVELIRQLTRRGQTVLACAPSNLAVDNIMQRLIAAGENAIRVGHPARVMPQLQPYTLDLLVESHPDTRIARKLSRDAHALRRQAGKYTRARPEAGARRNMRREAEQMLADARRIEAQVAERLLATAPIICATTGADRGQLGGRAFDWCVLDEAGQATEPEVWLPLQSAERLVLAGDHFQLPPTVISPEALAGGFNVSLLERLVGLSGPELSRRLVVQYRMHQAIMAFSSDEFTRAVCRPTTRWWAICFMSCRGCRPMN